MWPSSPAVPLAPTIARPLITWVAAMPVPMARKSTWLLWRAAPMRASASPPARTSWPITVGRPSRSVRSRPSGTLRKPTFADQTAMPLISSTTPGTTMPAAIGVRPSMRAFSARAAAMSAMSRVTASAPRSGQVGCRSVCSMRPWGRTSAHFMVVPPTSMATITSLVMSGPSGRTT